MESSKRGIQLDQTALLHCLRERLEQRALYEGLCVKRVDRDSLPIRRCPANAASSPISITTPQMTHIRGVNQLTTPSSEGTA